MADSETGFKRMIIGLPHNPRDYPAVSTTVWLAKQLGIDLIGTVFEDVGLAQLADLPEAREFRAMSSWQPLSAAQLTSDLARMSAEAQRMFSEIIAQQRTSGSFQLARGSAADFLVQAGANDIVAIVDPKNPLERITRQFRELVDIIFQTAASVLIVPSSPPVDSRQLVAAGSRIGDPAIATAIAIAASAKEPLTIIPLEQSPQALARVVERARQLGVRTTVAQPMLHGADLSSLATVSCNLKGKLLIAGRERFAIADHSFSQLRVQIPLLLVRSGASSPWNRPDAAEDA
jgi:hypothetical protein